MTVEIRIYTQYDPDLYSLVAAGYPVGEMLHNAVSGYANGTMVYYLIDEILPMEIKGKNTIHLRFNVPESDRQTCYLLRKVQNRMRNTFCKLALRNCLIQQNLPGFLTDPALYAAQEQNLRRLNQRAYPGVIPTSTLQKESRQLSYMGKTVEAEHKQAVGKLRTRGTKETSDTDMSQGQMPMNYPSQMPGTFPGLQMSGQGTGMSGYPYMHLWGQMPGFMPMQGYPMMQQMPEGQMTAQMPQMMPQQVPHPVPESMPSASMQRDMPHTADITQTLVPAVSADMSKNMQSAGVAEDASDATREAGGVSLATDNELMDMFDAL